MTKYAKAIVGALIAALGTLSTALADNGVTPQEWVTIAVTFLVTGGSVFGVPNKADPVIPDPPDVAAIMHAAVADYHRSLSTIQAIAAATDQAVAPPAVPIPPGPVQVITPTP